LRECRLEKCPHYDEGVHANYLVYADALKKDQRVPFEVVNDDRRNKPRADQVRVL